MVIERFMKGAKRDINQDILFVRRGSTLLCRTTLMNITESNRFIINLITVVSVSLGEDLDYKEYPDSYDKGYDKFMKSAESPLYREPYLRRLSEPNPVPEVVKVKKTRAKKK